MMSIIERAVHNVDFKDEESTIGPLAETAQSATFEQNAIERVIGRNAGDGQNRFTEPGDREGMRSASVVKSVLGNGDILRFYEADEDAENRGVTHSPISGDDESSGRIYKIDRRALRRSGIVQPEGSREPVAECVRLIKSQLLVSMSENQSDLPTNLIMVTSSLPGEGKTFVATNLAISMAMERGRRVLLVDADVARPSVPRVLGLDMERQVGLNDVLEQRLDVEQHVCRTDIGNLSFLPAGMGHHHSTELLSSAVMQELVQDLAHKFDDRIVIFDSPPLLAASEAGALARHMGQIVVVVESGKTTEQVLVEALDRLEARRIAGLVLNKDHSDHRRYGYGYQQ